MVVIIQGVEVTVHSGIMGYREVMPKEFYDTCVNILRGYYDAGYDKSMTLQEFVDKLGMGHYGGV